MGYKYKNAVLGGTFDHLHEGHKYFLDMSFKKAEKVTIGLTTSSMHGKKKSKDFIEDYDRRENNLKKYLSKKKYSNRFQIIPINDIYGNTLEEKKLEAIIVTTNLVGNANLINNKRIDLGFSPLKIEVVPLLKNASGQVYSSSSIRKGKKVFSLSHFDCEYLKMPESLRAKLGEPFGEVSTNMQFELPISNRFVIAVGDIVVSSLVENKLIPNISIYDSRTQRQKIEDNRVLENLPSPIEILKNTPGTINCNVVKKLYRYISKSLTSTQKYALKIDGEEDLLALPAILLSPIGGVVIYGIKDVGAVIVMVNIEKQTRIMNLLNEFKAN